MEAFCPSGIKGPNLYFGRIENSGKLLYLDTIVRICGSLINENMCFHIIMTSFFLSLCDEESIVVDLRKLNIKKGLVLILILEV